MSDGGLAQPGGGGVTEHVVPVVGEDQGVLSLHRADTIRVAGPVVLSLDSIGFGRLNVAWRSADVPCMGCEICVEHGPVPSAELAARHTHCGPALLHCGACGHHACPFSGAARVEG